MSVSSARGVLLVQSDSCRLSTDADVIGVVVFDEGDCALGERRQDAGADSPEVSPQGSVRDGHCHPLPVRRHARPLSAPDRHS